MEKSFDLQHGDLSRYIKTSALSALSKKAKDQAIIIKNESMELRISKKTGLIKSLKHQNKPYIIGEMQPNYFRAVTDNDRGGGKNSYFNIWKRAGLDSLTHKATSLNILHSDSNEIQVKAIVHSISTDAKVRTNAAIQTTFVYTVKSDNTIHVTVKSDLSKVAAPSLPRVGIRFAMASGFENFEWYGNGPDESYSDRKDGVTIGLYKGSVSSQWVPYPEAS
ncbi:MAG: hypothetical protein WCR36_05300 [Bacteroidaceae bacterium]